MWRNYLRPDHPIRVMGKIAIVAPASVPYIVGGAEKLYESLKQHINDCTSSSCEIISLPSPENSFYEVIDSYQRFSELELDQYDLVVSTKYPSWMVSHKNHVCYMLHTLRGLYDTYHLMNLPEHVDWESEGLGELKAWMEHALQSPSDSNNDLRYFFQKVKQLYAEKQNSALFAFPGPFIRELVHFLDSYALSRNRIKRHFAISSTVASRENYFPKGISAKPLYPAPLINNFECKKFEYIFTISRLDTPKRIDMIIESFKFVKTDVQLIIAGDGPQRNYLERLASKDRRIKFVGPVPDTELTQYYANALAIVFVPFDEDYGYITIEAMKSSKPVLTTTDSGGPNEFVRDGENGFSVSPDPRSIAEKIDYFCQNMDATRQMGNLAAQTVRNIEWPHVVDRLISGETTQGAQRMAPVTEHKEKIVVVVTFSVYPPRGGGQARVFNLYRNLAKYYEVEIICLSNSKDSFRSRLICPGLKETRVPVTTEFESHEASFSSKCDWKAVTDIAAIDGYKLVKKFASALKSAVKSADIIVASHPYLINAIRAAGSDARIWYEAHNVELDLKTQLLPRSEFSSELLRNVHEVEKKCWLDSEIVYACTNEDLVRLEELYGPTKALKSVVPNGVDHAASVSLNWEEKNLLKTELGIGGKKTVVFMGSWHGPNLEATDRFIRLAADFPDVYFFLVGSAGQAFEGRQIPNNVILFGVLDGDEKNVVMCASDVAVNPMISGSGSNLKMLDFMAYGLPVISTPFGARGLGLVPGTHYISTEIDSFSLELCRFFALQGRYRTAALTNREFVSENFAWSTIAEKFHDSLLNEF